MAGSGSLSASSSLSTSRPDFKSPYFLILQQHPKAPSKDSTRPSRGIGWQRSTAHHGPCTALGAHISLRPQQGRCVFVPLACTILMHYCIPTCPQHVQQSQGCGQAQGGGGTHAGGGTLVDSYQVAAAGSIGTLRSTAEVHNDRNIWCVQYITTGTYGVCST
jgi:hypothetical protein